MQCDQLQRRCQEEPHGHRPGAARGNFGSDLHQRTQPCPPFALGCAFHGRQTTTRTHTHTHTDTDTHTQREKRERARERESERERERARESERESERLCLPAFVTVSVCFVPLSVRCRRLQGGPITQVEQEEMAGILADAKADALKSGVTMNTNLVTMEYCDFLTRYA